MLAEALAILAAFSFGLNLVTSRRGLVSGHIYTGVLISVAVGVPMFLLLSVTTREFYDATVSLDAVIALALAGVLHFGVGRALLYKSVHLVGSNITGSITASNTLYSVLLGVVVLGEKPSLYDVLGTALILIGLVLITLRGARIIKSYRGFIYAFITSIIFAVTPILVKVGTASLNAPILATSISYTAALIPYLALLMHSRFRCELLKVDFRILKYLLLAALTVNMAQLLRYISLSLGNVSSVTPIISTNPLFGITLSYIFNRNMEDFNVRIVAGAALIVIGITLITLPS